MLLKAIPITATASGSAENTSIAETDLQLVTVAQLQEVIDQITANRTLLENRLNIISMAKIKMPLVERFRGEKFKLKEFLT